jgi:hypothetical protein
MDVWITGLNVGGEVFADEAVEESAEDILLEVPAIDRATHVVGDFPNLALQGGALLDACHDWMLVSVSTVYRFKVAVNGSALRMAEP